MMNEAHRVIFAMQELRFHPHKSPFSQTNLVCTSPLSAEREAKNKCVVLWICSSISILFFPFKALHHLHFLGPCSLHRGRGLTTSPRSPLRALTRSRSVGGGAVDGVYSPPFKDVQ